MKRWFGSLFVFGSLLFGSSAAQALDAIATTNLNIRTGPGARYAVRTAVPPKYPLQVKSCTRGWCQVNYRGYTGWVSARYLAFKQQATPARRYAPRSTTTLFIGPFWGGPRYYRPYWGHRGGYWGHRGGHWGHRGGHWGHHRGWGHRGGHWGHRW